MSGQGFLSFLILWKSRFPPKKFYNIDYVSRPPNVQVCRHVCVFDPSFIGQWRTLTSDRISIVRRLNILKWRSLLRRERGWDATGGMRRRVKVSIKAILYFLILISFVKCIWRNGFLSTKDYWAVFVVAQFAEWSLPSTEVCSSNPVIGNFYWTNISC